ncbi:MAG: acetamidase/formamidase family protein [Lachnospiraceae bacterium]|nr:acetamidase/formamidase family protein [Lachnospiraceae bacterium]
MITISKDYVVDILKGGQEPAGYCESGDTAVFETKDCYDDNDITEENPYGNHPDGLENPATGPLYVQGAEPGDVLKVEIGKIRLRGYGIMRTSVTDGAFHHLYQEKTARRFYFETNPDTGREGFWFDDKLWLDCDTMIGVIGTAPEGDGVLTITPGAHGGNMDCNRITEGSVLYLPVHVPGALLSMGDLHARMGDGEVMICGLETGGTVEVRVTVLKSGESTEAGALWEALPLLVSGKQVMTIQSAENLDEAAAMAAQKMQRLAAKLTGLDDVNSGMLMSLLGNLVICQIVNPLKTVRCEFPLEVLAAYGGQLP